MGGADATQFAASITVTNIDVVAVVKEEDFEAIPNARMARIADLEFI